MMKLKAYHSILIFAILVAAAVFSSVSSYRRAQYALVKDMDKALAQTLQEKQYQWITPDTIQSYRSHLSIDLLKETSNLCYVQPTNGTSLLSSREMKLRRYKIQGYATCSMLDIFGMSNQRTSLSLSLMAMLWAIWSVYEHRRKKPKVSLAIVDTTKDFEDAESIQSLQNVKAFGSLAYSTEEDYFFNQENQQPIKFTPMQHQLMLLFMQSPHHQLSKQEICEALWPKKPDASETLYTLIRRIKPVIEAGSNLMIESERGRAYRLRCQ